MKTAGYPGWLEAWWIDAACRFYGVSELPDCAGPIRKAIERLTDTFTIDREDCFADYQRDPELLLAYGLFFFPRSFVRAQFPICELLARGWRPLQQRPLRVLDVGAGAGATGLGAATQLCLTSGASIEGLALDRSGVALQMLAELAAAAPSQRWITAEVDLRTGIPAAAQQSWDLILAGFSLNELWDRMLFLIENLMRRLEPHGVLLVLEPAVKETSERLEALRDRIASEGKFHIWAPCLHSASCPLLQEGQYWCHEVRTWEVPASVSLLNRHLHRSVEVLKFSFLALSPAAPPVGPAGPERFRMIAPFTRAHGKWLTAGCSAEGRRRQYEILRREVTPELADWIKSCERGDIVEVDPRRLEEFGETIRLRMKGGR